MASPTIAANAYANLARVLENSGAGKGKPVFARLARESVEIPGPDSERLGAIARELGIHLAVGVNERDGGTLYNSLPA